MTMRVRVLVSLAIASAAMVLASCGHYTCGSTFGSSSCSTSAGGINGGGNGSGGQVFAFLLAESQTSAPAMTADQLDLSTNTFNLLGSAFKTPTISSTIGALDGGTVVVNFTSQKYLYIPFSDGTLFGYAIDGTTGALSPVPGIPFAAAGGTSIAADPAGRFLFVSDSGGGGIAAFTISSTNGSLTPVSGSPFLSGISPVQMATDGKGKFLYATDGGVNVVAFAINQTTGALAAVAGSPFVFSPGMAQVEGENTGNFLLGISGTDSKLHVLGINSTSGAIAEVSGSPFPTIQTPSNIVVHPTGAFVYAIRAAGFPVEGYQINPTSGALTAISGSPFAGVMVDFGQFDQTGKFFFGVGVGNVGASFGPYPTDPSTGVMGATKFQLLGFPGAGFAVSDLNNAP